LSAGVVTAIVIRFACPPGCLSHWLSIYA